MRTLSGDSAYAQACDKPKLLVFTNGAIYVAVLLEASLSSYPVVNHEPTSTF